HRHHRRICHEDFRGDETASEVHPQIDSPRGEAFHYRRGDRRLPEREGMMSERFRPPPHIAPDTALHKVLYGARLALDLQFKTVHGDMKRFLPGLSGTLVDVGAGNGPFKHLLRPTVTEYIGLDIDAAGNFGYGEAQNRRFDGERIPLETASV